LYEHAYAAFAVKIHVNGTKQTIGSGCLFQPTSNEYTYVLTAKHCLIGKDPNNPNIFSASDILIFRDPDYESELLTVVDYKLYPNDNHDIACIIVKKIDNLPILLAGIPNRKSQLITYGYPNILSTTPENEFIGQLFDAKIAQISSREQRRFTAQINSSFLTFDNDALTNIEGYSGSGVYIQDDNGIMISGIIIELKHPSGVFSEVIIESIMSFNPFLLENSLCTLEPECLTSFDVFFNEAFLGYKEMEKIWLKRRLCDSVSPDINPAKIKEALKEKLIIPYSDYSEPLSVLKDLWKGWVLLLVALSYDSKFRLVEKDLLSPIFLYKSNSNNDIDPIHHFFVTRFHNFHDCIEHIVTKDNIFDDIRQNGIVIVNNSGSFKATGMKKSQIKRIITDISRIKPLHGGINIDDPETDKNFSVLHLKKLQEVFENVDWDMEFSDIDTEIIKALERVFEYVRDE